MRPVLRQATERDIPQLLDMVEEFRRSSLYDRYIGQNTEQVRHTITWMLKAKNAAIFVAEMAESQLIGMLGIVAYVHPISGEETASELFWWLDPAHRGWGGWLLHRAEKWAKSVGCRAMQMIAPSDAPHVGVMYQRVGYTCMELSYTKRLV